MLTSIELAEILKITPFGYKTPEDDFFADANKALRPEHRKLGVISDPDEEKVDAASPTAEIFCNIPGCQLRFTGVAAFQTHFNGVHRFRCVECRRALPTAHLLDLHLSEQHDSYFGARVARGDADMYACLLEECKQRLPTPELRKTHCIQAHKFPGSFRFDQLSASSCGKGKKSQKASGRKSAPAVEAMDTEVQSVRSTEDVRRIKAFSFGHQKGAKTFHTASGRRPQEAGATLNDLHAMKEALEQV